MTALDWMQSLSVSEWITDSNWGFPIMLALHSIGMAGVVGILIMLDLRILGFARSAPLPAFQPLMSVAWVGFFINLFSGTLMFMADANRLIVNWSFLVKMTCVVLGGGVSALLWRRMRAAGANRPMATQATDTVLAEPLAIDRSVRVLSILSIGLWTGAILFGRVIAYVMDHMILHGAVGGR